MEKMDEPTVFPSSVDGQITRAQLAKIGGNRKCLKNVHVKSEQAWGAQQQHNSGLRSARPPSGVDFAPHRQHGRFPLSPPLVYVVRGPACRAASVSNPR